MHKNPTHFKKWVLHNFGKGIGEHFFYPYQEKIFSYPVEKLSSSWTGRFVPTTDLTAMIQGAVQPPKDLHIGYNAQFYYPHTGGIFFWIKKLYQQIRKPVALKHVVQTIDLQEKRIICQDGSTYIYETLINTMPLNLFLTMVKNPLDSWKQAAKKLLCNSVVNFNLGIKRENVSDKHWIYYPEKKYPFYRIGFSSNFARSMAPDGCSSLYGEFSHLGQPAHLVDQMLQTALAQTKKVLTLEEHEIVTEKIITIPHAYVIFDQWRDKHLAQLLSALQEAHIHSIGRYGGWKYSSMQEGLLEGKAMAEQLLVSNI